MPQRAQAAALSTSASGSSAPAAAPSTDGGWTAEAQPSTGGDCTDESSGQDCEAQSREPAEQQPQPLLMQWLASVDPGTRRHAAGVMAAVSAAQACPPVPPRLPRCSVNNGMLPCSMDQAWLRPHTGRRVGRSCRCQSWRLRPTVPHARRPSALPACRSTWQPPSR